MSASPHLADSCGPGDVYTAMCPCRDMLDLLANKWSALAIGALEDGPQRFGELRRLGVPGTRARAKRVVGVLEPVHADVVG